MIESDPKEWWTTWEINIKGVYLLSRAFIPLLLKGGSKTIVNVSSVGALFVMPGASAYQTTKFALLRFTEFLAKEYEAQGIVTFAVHPGGVQTELALNMPEAVHGFLTDTPELAGDTLSYLTQKPQSWLIGRFVSVNWDMPEFFARKEEVVQGDKLKMRLVL